MTKPFNVEISEDIKIDGKLRGHVRTTLFNLEADDAVGAIDVAKEFSRYEVTSVNAYRSRNTDES